MVVSGWGDKGGKADHRGNLGQWTLCDTIMMDTCNYTFAQTPKMYNTNSEL